MLLLLYMEMPKPKVIAPPTIIPSLTYLSMSLFMIPPPVRNRPIKTNPRLFRIRAALTSDRSIPANAAIIVPIHASRIPSNTPIMIRFFENSGPSVSCIGRDGLCIG